MTSSGKHRFVGGCTMLKRVFLSAVAACMLCGAALTASASATVYKVVGTGGILHVRTAPSLAAPIVANLPDGTSINIVCQTRGDQVVGSTMWDKIDQPAAGYVADWYTTTPVVNNPSPGLPTSGSPPPPPPPPPAQYTELRNRASVRCLDANSATLGSNGTAVMLWDCWGGPNQNWLVGADGTIRNQASGRCLDADANTISRNGTIVHLWDCNGHANQRWSLDGNGTIRNQASGRPLDANGWAINVNGTGVQLWDNNGGRNQSWYAASPTVLPQVSSFTYCAPNKVDPYGQYGNGSSQVAFKPCIRVTDAHDGTSAAPRSTPSGSQCPKFTYAFIVVPPTSITDNLACTITENGNYWNGNANVDYVKMSAGWDDEVVTSLGWGDTVLTTDTITHETDLDTVAVATSPNGQQSGSVSIARVDYNVSTN